MISEWSGGIKQEDVWRGGFEAFLLGSVRRSRCKAFLEAVGSEERLEVPLSAA